MAVAPVRLTWRDGIATLLVGAATVLYLGHLLSVHMPSITDVGDVAAAGLLLGFVACVVDKWTIKNTAVVRALSVLSLSAIGIGIAAMATESESLLAVFVGTLMTLWVVTTMAHAGVIARSHSGGRTRRGPLPTVHS